MAVRTCNFVFVHVPKTGGTWTTDVLLTQDAPADKPEHAHLPLSGFTADYVGERTVFANIRDPWTWYRSWWAHNVDMTWRSLLEGYGNGRDDFKSVLYGLTHPNEVSVPEPVGGYWPTQKSDKERLLRFGGGFWSFCYDYMITWPITMIATDRLHEGLSRLLNSNIQMQFTKKRNVSTVPVPEYTPEMVDWVARADADLIDRFGFEPFQPSPKAVYHA